MRIGFIGIGNMGTPMAGHLIKGGHDVTVFDTNAKRAAEFAAAHKATAAARLDQLGACEVIVTMLPTGGDVRHVLLEAHGGVLLKALKPGTVVIDMSSSEPVGTQKLGKSLAKKKVVLIDAPVSGGVARAKTGTLAIMIGTDDTAALERVRPVLKLMGDRLFETGALGTGHAMKALNNFCAASAFAATSEALIIGDAFGLDRAKMVEIMNVSTGRNFHTDVVMKEHVVGEKFATGFTVGLLAKDVAIAESLGAAMKINAPILTLVTRRWADARDTVGADKDNTEAYNAWLKPQAKPAAKVRKSK